jgi:hypothetical protein
MTHLSGGPWEPSEDCVSSPKVVPIFATSITEAMEAEHLASTRVAYEARQVKLVQLDVADAAVLPTLSAKSRKRWLSELTARTVPSR